MRPIASSASFVATLAATAAVSMMGCGGNVDFSIKRDLNVDSVLNAGATSSDYDLAAEAGGAWKQRKHIDKITIRGATATVTNANWQGNNTATTVSGTVWLHELGVTDRGQWVQVGTWAGAEVLQDNVIPLLQPSAQLDDFITGQLKGDGKFTVVAEGAGAGGARVSVTLHVVIDATLKWKAF